MTNWLIDTSALVRLARSPESSQWAERLDRGLVRIATVTLLEVGFSVRSGAELRAALRQVPLAAMRREHLTPAVEDRALDISWHWPSAGCTASRRSRTCSSPPLPSSAGW